jgi:drug/metabolite transporter (DMT)-like permease
MPASVALAVLAAALLHACWNALIRGAGDKVLYTLLLHGGSGLLGFAGLVWTGLPPIACWPYILTSVLIHTLYIAWLMQAYEGGQLAVSYVLMRGLPPLLVALCSAIFLGEALGVTASLGILCLSFGVLSIGMASGQPMPQMLRHSSTRSALLNALAIAGYTLVDGHGVRLAVNPLSYAFCLMAFEPVIILALNLRQRHLQLRSYFNKHWRIVLTGAACATGAYATVLWAMTQAPIAMVAALRESSVVFAVLIGSLWFGEGKLRQGLSAGVLVLAGLFLLRV